MQISKEKFEKKSKKTLKKCIFGFGKRRDLVILAEGGHFENKLIY